MTNFQAAKGRIIKADSIEALNKLVTSFERIYNVGILTESELMRLDALIVDKLILIEN